MKPLATAAVGSALLTAVGAWSLRASDPTSAVAAVAVTAALVAWLCSFHGSREHSGLGLAGAAHLVPLALVGRAPAATALPVIAAQVVGAVVTGFVALTLDLNGGTLLWDEPSWVGAAALGVVVGLVTAWSTLAADGSDTSGSGAGWLATGSVASGALLGVGLTTAAQPAVLLGVAVAGLVSWPVALIVGVAVLVGAAVGPFLVSWVSPHDA